MHKHTHLLCGLLGLMTLQAHTQAKSIHYLHDDSWFNSMHNSMRTMHEHMMKNMQEMQKAFDELATSMPMAPDKSPQKQTVALDANDTQVIISLDVPGALANAMKAERNLDTITIEVPQADGTTKVRVSTHALSIEHTQELKQDDGYSSNRHAYMERTLPHEVDMSGDISIEHIEESNTLNITLTRKHKRKAPQQLPIVKK